MFVSGVQLEAVPQSLDPEVLLKVKSEIEEELKSLEKEVSEGLFPLASLSSQQILSAVAIVDLVGFLFFSFCCCVVSVFTFEIGFHHVTLAGPTLAM